MDRPRTSPQPGQGDVIVVGASLVGLLTALSLAHVGIPVTVLERAGAPRASGAAPAVDGSALRAALGPACANRVLDGVVRNRTDGSIP